MSDDDSVAQLLAVLEGLAVELGDAVVLDACRRFLADPARGFTAALRRAIGDAERVEWRDPQLGPDWP